MGVHPTALIHPKAQVAADADVGPFCVIDENVRIASGCRLYQGVFVTGWTQIDENCEVHPGVIVGHAPQDIKYTGARSYCRIGRGTILREYVTVHRGTVPESETIVGEECFLLAGSHVAHNCRVGHRVTLINNALLGGHVTIGDRATVGGGSAIHQFVRVGELVMIAGVARVVQDVPPFALVDAEGHVAGLNRVGMRRAGMAREEFEDIRNAYRVVYGRGVHFRREVERLAEAVVTPAGRRLHEFLKQETKRGIAGRSRRRRASEADAGES